MRLSYTSLLELVGIQSHASEAFSRALAVKGNWTLAFTVKDSCPNHDNHFAALLRCVCLHCHPADTFSTSWVLWLTSQMRWQRGQPCTGLESESDITAGESQE